MFNAEFEYPIAVGEAANELFSVVSVASNFACGEIDLAI